MLALAYAPLVSRLPPDRRPAMTADFAEALFHAVRCDRDEPWGRRQAMDGLRAVLARGRLNPCEHLATQKRLQRDLEEQLQALAKAGDGPRRRPPTSTARRRRAGSPFKVRTPICLSHHPANPPTPEEVIARARSPMPAG